MRIAQMARMFVFFTTFFHSIRGPKLFRIFGSDRSPGYNYEPNIVESGSDKVIGSLRFVWSLAWWTSPLLMGILYRRGHFTPEGAVNLTKLGAYGLSMYYTAMLCRGFGRSINPEYASFIAVLQNARKDFNEENRLALERYDYEYSAAPLTWSYSDTSSSGEKKARTQAAGHAQEPFSILTIPRDILSYMCAHTFGRRMVYPGATALINTLVVTPLNQGRSKLVEEMNGHRAKIETEDKNEIDTMFVDRRSTGYSQGKSLVIACEGNAGFYEIGAMATPLELGYSVLGWNHPGFAGSSGIPLPEQEQCAIDAVVQYAIHKLGFLPEEIVLYAWSIGGYTASWAAMNYPEAEFVILDATFDELIPLALAKMPEFAKSLVEATVKKYLDLDVASQLIKYPGPVLLIRRSRDEMITTKDPTAIDTNRGNFLLTKLLKHRYPAVIADSTLQEWVNRDKRGQDELWLNHSVDPDWCEAALRSYKESKDAGHVNYPWMIGDSYTQEQKNTMTLFLASRYMVDFDSTHCTPLPSSFFRKPWTV